MICRVMQDWTPLKWFPLIETRTTGVFLESNPNVPYDMVPCLTDWRFRRRKSEWQPIETAPEQPMLLLFQPHSMGGFMFVGVRNNAGEWINNLDMQVQHPTHWMPLPPAPTTGDTP